MVLRCAVLWCAVKINSLLTGWLLDQRPFLPHLRKPAPPVVLRPPKHRGWARYAHQRRADVRFVRPLDLPSQNAPGQGGWRRTQTTGEAGTHPRREWPAPAPRAPPRPFRRRLRLKRDGSVRSWRRQTPDGLFVEQFAEQKMLNLDATRARAKSTDAARVRNEASGIGLGAPGHIAGRRHCRARLAAPVNR